MIENATQYRITKERLREFSDALKEQERLPSADPLEQELYVNALKSQIEVFERDLSTYEMLKS